MANPIQSLQINASDFFDRVFQNNSDKMQCKKSCSACCYADFSVSEGEANLIREWFSGQPEAQQKELIALWSTDRPTGLDPLGRKKMACAFLKNSECTIYEARPIICRTQGLPLKMAQENKKTKETEIQVDCCPLNFSNGNELPDPSDWLDLDRLNQLKGIAEKFQNEKADPENRIDLSTLAKGLKL